MQEVGWDSQMDDKYLKALERTRDIIVSLHKEEEYSLGKLGTLYKCSHCRDSRGHVFILYPCPTVKLILNEIEYYKSTREV